MKKTCTSNGLTSGDFIKKSALFFSKKIFSLLLLMVCVFSFSSNAQVYNYFNGFETTNGQFNWAAVTRVNSGTNGIPSFAGSMHAVVPNNNNGSSTRFGNTTPPPPSGPTMYNATFPANGYKTSLHIYLNVEGGWTNDTKFDYSSAINDATGVHRRDWIFNVGFYNDATSYGSGNRFVIAASSNAAENPRNPVNSPMVISTSGWYRFEHSFRNNGGALAVDFTIYDASNNVAATWTRNSPTDIIGSTIGGARYGWVLNNQFSPLAIDNSALTINCAPFTVTTSTTPACPSQSNGTATVTSVSSMATPYTYDWKNSSNVTVSTSQTATGLAAGTYTVTVTDANGCTGTQTATVGTGSAPSFTTNLSQSNAVCAGNNITYNVAVTGTGPFTFQWLKDGVPVNNSAHTTITSTATTSSLTINNIVPGDAGNYTVTVTGACAPPATSGQAALTVYTLPVFTACPMTPINTTTSADATGNCSTTATYNATATSTAYPASGGNTPLTFNYSYSFSNATTASGSGTGSGSVFNKGTTNVVVTATNTCGSVTCVFDVIVADDEKPVITCTTDKAVSTNLGVCTFTKTGTDWDATATDNCGTVGLTYTYTLSGATPSGTGSSLNNVVFNKGTTTVTWTASDGTNTSLPCDFDVVVTDNEAPVVTCSTTPITASNGSDGCTAVVNYPSNAATATDNCTAQGSIVITYSPPSGSTFDVGTTTVTVTAKDEALNTSTCTFNVVVNNVTGNLYVNDAYIPGTDVYTTAAGDDMNGNGTKCKPYATINKAISVATAGNTIFVDAGTYIENVACTTAVQLRGANYTINPNTGTRVAESIVSPLTSNTTPNTGAFIIGISVAGVTVDGFTLDGSKSLSSSSISSNGVPVDAAYGIAAQGSVSNETISNNIFRNIADMGIILVGNNTGTSGNTISNNKFDNIQVSGAAYRGAGAYLFNSAYASITNNVMTNVKIGAQTTTFGQADPGNSRSISNNIIESSQIGIWHNNQFGAASTYTISNNTIATDAGATANNGIRVSNIGVFAGSTTQAIITGNNITGALNGYNLWSNPTTPSLKITGGTVTNCTNGILATNYDAEFPTATVQNSTYVVDNVAITGGTNGINVNDDNAAGSATVAVTIQNSTSISGTANGLLLSGAGASAAFSGTTPASFAASNTKYIVLQSNGTDAPTAMLDATTASFDGQTGGTASPAQNFVIEDKIDHKIDLLPLGFVLVKTDNAFVTDVAPLTPTATNNDYTRVRNGILAASNDFTINHNGTFDWVEPNANASWAAGNDGNTGTTADNYSILVPGNLNGITFTAPEGLGTATITGPGDVPNVNLESVLYFTNFANSVGRTAKNWTISNMDFQKFDLSIGYFHTGGGPIDAYENFKILNNHFLIPKDLNPVAAGGDASQNIGIHFSFGKNQDISGNTFDIEGDGVSGAVGANFSTSVAMQSNTDGGTAYDGLTIQNNTINILQAQSATPSRIIGIWENGGDINSAITISGNKYVSTASGNDPAVNSHRAFRITSQSGPTKNLVYQNNEVTGANVGFEWITGYTYTPGTPPVQLLNNKVDNTFDAVQVRTNGASALINNNSFTNTGRFAINNMAPTGTVNGTCNWYGTASANVIATKINGSVTYIPYLTDGTDASGSTGFQPDPNTNTCNGTPVTIAVTATINESCGKNNGSITVAASGGKAPYTYTISGPANTTGATSGVFTGLTAGMYTITVTDGNTSTATTTATLTYNPVTNTTANPDKYYLTIQAAIDDAAPNDVLEVCKGLYTENIVVNKALTINGPNAGTSGCNVRVDEAIIQPAISGPEYGPGESVMMEVQASGVTINGFTFNGDNPALMSAKNANGANIDAVDGIGVYTPVGNLSITNNIFKNINEAAFDQFYTDATPTSGNIINNNSFDNIPGTIFGQGVAFYNNFYATVENNCMTRVSIGVQTGNAHLPNPGVPATISNNNIKSSFYGIWHNNQFGTASPWTISGNTLTTEAGATTNTGLFISSIFNAVSVPVSNNSVTGAKYGIEIWNAPTTNTVTISNGTLTNCETGIFTNNYDSYQDPANLASGATTSIINGVNISGGTVGIHVKDNTANTNNAPVVMQIQGGTTISNSGTGLRIEGMFASASFNGATPATFTGQTKYITYASNGADWPTADINATTVNFDGSLGSGKTLADLFTTEDKIDHKIDYAVAGFVTVNANNTYVTPNSFIAPTTTEAKIQRGVDAAGPTGFTENVQDGTYNDNVAVNKEIIITGQSQAGVIVYPATSNPNCGGAGGGSLCGGTSSNVFLVQANNVTIQTLTADGNNTAINSGTMSNGVDVDARNGIITDHGTVALVTGLNVNNVTVKNMYLRGIYASTDYGTFNFSNNTVTNVAGDAGESSGILNFGGSGTIANNTVTSSYVGIGTQNSFGTTFSGNTVTDCIRGIEVDNAGAASGSGSDLVTNNLVTNTGTGVANSFGITVFNPYVAPTVQENTVTNVQTGLANIAQVVAVTPVFTRNTVNGSNRANSIGVLQTTDRTPFGSTNVSGTFTNNFIQNNAAGVRVEYQSGFTNNITVKNNSITGNTTGVVLSGTGTLVNDFECNWWGSNDPAMVAAAVGSPANGIIDYIPYLSSGAESDPTPGFQPSTPCATCTTLTAAITSTNNQCNGGSTGTITASASNGVGPYTYTLSGTGANNTGNSNGMYTGLPAGTYTVTASGANGCSTTFTSQAVTITQPTATVPDITLSVADATDNFFSGVGSEITLLYQVQENNGNPALNDTLRITKQGGYTFSFPNVNSVNISGTTYTVDNQRWTVLPISTTNGPPAQPFYKVYINSGQQIDCGQSVFLAVKITRNTASKQNFALTSQITGVLNEAVTNNNSTIVLLVGN